MQMEKIDDLDIKILNILSHHAEKSYKEIGQELFVSGGTVHVRIKKLKEMGVITAHRMIVDYEKLGYDITAFLGIYLDKSSLYDDVSEQLRNIPEVLAAHYTTGAYSIFVKIICRDTNHLRDVLAGKIQNIKGIQRTETFISLQEGVDRPLLLE